MQAAVRLKAIIAAKAAVIADKKDTVTVDVPALIRMLEHSREDIKSDADLHRFVARVLDASKEGTITMDVWGKIVPEESSE